MGRSGRPLFRNKRRRGRKLLGLALKSLLALFVLISLPFIALRWIDPPTTALMLQNRDAMRAGGYPTADNVQTWVDYARMSPALPLAAVSAEDQRFPHHHGFDFAAIRAAWRDIRSGEDFRGGSTISQQVVKNLFLWRDQSWFRKALEAGLTVFAELWWPKQRMLEIYLNIAQFDSNVFGVEAACRKFFNKPARDVTPEEAALLVTALPAPSVHTVEKPSPFMLERQHWVLRQMQLLGSNYLSKRD